MLVERDVQDRYFVGGLVAPTSAGATQVLITFLHPQVVRVRQITYIARAEATTAIIDGSLCVLALVKGGEAVGAAVWPGGVAVDVYHPADRVIHFNAGFVGDTNGGTGPNSWRETWYGDGKFISVQTGDAIWMACDALQATIGVPTTVFLDLDIMI